MKFFLDSFERIKKKSEFFFNQKDFLISLGLFLLELELRILGTEIYLITCIIAVFILFSVKKDEKKTLFLYFIFVFFKVIRRFVDEMKVQPMYIFPSLPTAIVSSMYVELSYNERAQRIYFTLVLIGTFFDIIFGFNFVSHLSFNYLIVFVKMKGNLAPIGGFLSSLVFYEDFWFIQIILALIFFFKTEKKEEEPVLPTIKEEEEEKPYEPVIFKKNKRTIWKNP